MNDEPKNAALHAESTPEGLVATAMLKPGAAVAS